VPASVVGRARKGPDGSGCARSPLLFESAERYVYIEEQYFWIEENARDLNAWLRAKPDRFVFLVLPRRFSDIEIGDQIHYALRRRRLHELLHGVSEIPAGTDPATLPGNVEARVALFHIISRENLDPIYVHSKVVIVDDTWFTIGSANLTRRSWTFDSEINGACVDARLRRGGHVSARQFRIDLLAEHLQLAPAERALIEDPRDAFRILKEVLDGNRRWMRTHLLKADLAFTHYGPSPPDFDPILQDAVNLVADTDGTQTHFDLRLIDLGDFIFALRDSTEGLEYGGFGRLRFTFDVGALNRPPADVLVRVEMRKASSPASQNVTMGPWPATGPVDAGVLLIGQEYVVRATALAASTSAPIATAPEQGVLATAFLTTVNIGF